MTHFKRRFNVEVSENFDNKCDHLEIGDIADVLVEEHDFMGAPAEYYFCNACIEESDAAEAETLDWCTQCGGEFKVKELSRWTPYDFNPSAGEEPYLLCSCCKGSDKHKERVRKDKEYLEAEFDLEEELAYQDEYEESWDDDHADIEEYYTTEEILREMCRSAEVAGYIDIIRVSDMLEPKDDSIFELFGDVPLSWDMPIPNCDGLTGYVGIEVMLRRYLTAGLDNLILARAGEGFDIDNVMLAWTMLRQICANVRGYDVYTVLITAVILSKLSRMSCFEADFTNLIRTLPRNRGEFLNVLTLLESFRDKANTLV